MEAEADSVFNMSHWWLADVSMRGGVFKCFSPPDVRSDNSQMKTILGLRKNKTPNMCLLLLIKTVIRWNKLPEDLRLAPTLTTFKARLKNFMYTLAFC